MFIWTLKDIIAVTALALVLLFTGTLAVLERIQMWKKRRRANQTNV
jgi:hypothetical protein